MAEIPSRNMLDGETSPYLRQHDQNPVHWMPWTPDAFAVAKDQNRPIILSVGYAACHWCHVMAHESFEDPDVARVMNENFISIKVDREERPDVDQIYQHALALLGQHGGWPLTMFLTPDGNPFWGGTYFPKTTAYGRPGFVDVLNRIATIYRDQPDTIEQNRSNLAAELEKMGSANTPGMLTMQTLDEAARLMLGHVDRKQGGLGGAPKFPQPFLHEFLWRAALRTGDEDLRTAVLTTLDHMADGGIYDHLGGGFARYSVDARWLAPHFEKMLYDNAQLISLYTLVWQKERNPLYKQRVEETVSWLTREMLVENRAYAAALDADSEGREGAYYVWDMDEITKILGTEDTNRFSRQYDVTPSGNWEGHTILNRLHRAGHHDEAEEDYFRPLRQKLLSAREKRPRPARDDKVLADWNGLVVEALAFAGQVFNRPEWIDLTSRAYGFILEKMAADDNGRLYHNYCGGRASHRAMLDDYANMTNGALALHEVTEDPVYLEQARSWVEIVQTDFSGPDTPQGCGGYFVTSADATDLIVRAKSIHDAAVPAGNSGMLKALARLYYLTGETKYRDRARGIVEAFGGEAGRSVVGITSFMNGYDLLENAVQIVILGEGPDRDLLKSAIYGLSLPNRVVQMIRPGEELPENHPAMDKAMVDGKATAYICVGTTCSAPVTTGQNLVDALATLSKTQG